MRNVLIIMLLLFAAGAMAQDQTPREDGGGRGYFGAPVVKYTAIRDRGAVMFGGRGGWNITPSLAVGGGLYGTMSEVDAREGAAPKGGPDAPGPLDVKFETFGFELEYAARPAAPTHLTLGMYFGGAAARYARDKTDEQQGETDFMFLLEPTVGLEQRVIDWLHLNIAVSYRLVGGVDQPGLTNEDLGGAALSLAVKFGRF